MAKIYLFQNGPIHARPYQVKLGDEGRLRSFGRIKTMVDHVERLKSAGHVLDPTAEEGYAPLKRSVDEAQAAYAAHKAERASARKMRQTGQKDEGGRMKAE